MSIGLNTKYYKQNKLVITSNASEENIFIDKIFINNQAADNYFLTKEILDTTQHIQFNLKSSK